MKDLLSSNGYLFKSSKHREFSVYNSSSIINKPLQSFTLATQLGIIRAAFFIGNNL